MKQHQEKIDTLLKYQDDMERDNEIKGALVVQKERERQLMAQKLKTAEGKIVELKDKVRRLEDQYIYCNRKNKSTQVHSHEFAARSRTVGVQTNVNHVDIEGAVLQKDEKVQIYLKNKDTGELIDYEHGAPVLEGHQVVKRIYRKRNIKVLMAKFRAAAKVAKLIGRMRKAALLAQDEAAAPEGEATLEGVAEQEDQEKGPNEEKALAAVEQESIVVYDDE